MLMSWGPEQVFNCLLRCYRQTFSGEARPTAHQKPKDVVRHLNKSSLEPGQAEGPDAGPFSSGCGRT